MHRQVAFDEDSAVVQMPVDCVDPHALHRFAPGRYPFLLQSTARDERLGCFDILFVGSDDVLTLESPQSKVDFLDALDERWVRERVSPSSSSLPFTGGWFLYLGYELAAQIEPALTLTPDSMLPTAFAMRSRAAVIRSHNDGSCWLVHEPDVDVSAVVDDIRAVSADTAIAALQPEFTPEVTEDPEQEFLDAVVRAKAYIEAGDVYQANLSRSWSATIDERLTPDRIYAALCAANPGPFAALARWQDTTIISSSPERLLRIRDGIASTRPIAGTRPRSKNRDADDKLLAELIAHPKERAEHVMLIDLERNDLGRVCEPGSVEVDEMMVLESYAHVHHIVSNVRGRLRTDVTPGAAIRAVFPGGTITGCPKVRCMQIINELEQAPRGAYTGSLGYLNRDGSLDLNIMIRTMVAQGPKISFRAGSGIVADSVPEAELEETRAKARGMLRALSP